MKSFLKNIFSKVSKAETSNQGFESKSYWDTRYLKKQNSGSGSYGRLAIFKAQIINNFVSSHNIQSVIDMGCGDGNQLALAKYPSYIGFDVSDKAIAICKKKFRGDKSKRFLNTKTLQKSHDFKANLVLSLDVIYHLIEDDVFEEYMQTVFSLSDTYVIIYSSNYEERIAEHVRCRVFTDWVKTEQLDFELMEIIKNEFPFDENHPTTTSMSDFYVYKKIV